MIQILELFGGIGAPRCALRNIGVPVKSIDYVEIDEKAVRSYNAIFENDSKYRAQSVVNYNLKPDFLIHGSPCQDFSIAGYQKGADKGSETRSSLMWETVHIIEQMGVWKPRVVIWENVKNVLSKHMRCNFNNYLNYMEHLGYKNSYRVLNAADYGLPQKRERVFVVSVIGNAYFDFDTMEQRKMQDIGNLLEKFESVPLKYMVTQRSMLAKIGKKNTPWSREGDIISNCAMSVTTKQMRYPNSGVIQLGDGTYRYLTERECWRLQGFTDEDYRNAAAVHRGKENCLNGELYKQAGNSMPVTVLEEIFRILLNNLYDYDLQNEKKEVEEKNIEEKQLEGQMSIFDWVKE